MMRTGCRHASTGGVLAALATVFVSAAAMAGETVDETREIQPDSLIEIINTRGEVLVSAWDRNEIQVNGELDDLAEEFIFEVRGNQARIEVKIPRRNVNWGDGSDLEIRVPAAARVSVDSVSSDVTVEGINGGTRINTASGDIRVRRLGTQYSIRAVSGDIDVADSTGSGKVSSVSGEIQLEADSTMLAVETVSGDIEVRLDTTRRLIVDAVSGDVEIRTRLADGGEIDISTVSSDLELELESPVNASLRIETGPGGDITNRLSEDPVESKFPAMSALRAELGSGSGSINLRTVSGDIRLDSAD